MIYFSSDLHLQHSKDFIYKYRGFESVDSMNDTIIKNFNQVITNEDDLDFEARVEHDFAIFIPAGKWHNLVNDSDEALKVYSIYSPSEHPHSTVHQTQAEGIEAHATEHGH